MNSFIWEYGQMYDCTWINERWIRPLFIDLVKQVAYNVETHEWLSLLWDWGRWNIKNPNNVSLKSIIKCK